MGDEVEVDVGVLDEDRHYNKLLCDLRMFILLVVMCCHSSFSWEGLGMFSGCC